MEIFFIYGFMHQFKYRNGKLFCESVDLDEVAGRYGTPCYVYSANTMRENYRRLVEGLAGLDVRVCYAMKANSNLAVLRLFANLGASFDLVSGGEIRRVLAAGGDIGTSVFAGVGKTAGEIELALRHGIFSFHVESEPELERIDAVAGRLGMRAPVAVRVNPDVDAGTHAKITTGKSENKFGVPFESAADVYRRAAELENLEIRGVQIHIGSQITGIDPFVAAVEKLRPLVTQLKAEYGIRYFSIGGGVGIVYEAALASGEAAWWDDEAGGKGLLTPERYGRALAPLLKDLDLEILLEPGRYMVGNAGVLLTRVEHVKRSPGRNFVIVDAAMNDLLRPAMYEAFHEIVPVAEKAGGATFEADVVGPICETGDCFAKRRRLPEVGEGDRLAVLSAGAYGYVMAGRYNTRSMPAEVLVDGDRTAEVAARETFERIVANEKIPEFL